MIKSYNYKDFKIESYLALFQQFKLPLVPLLSKSGGLHCYLFLKEPIPTIDLIEAFKYIINELKNVKLLQIVAKL